MGIMICIIVGLCLVPAIFYGRKNTKIEGVDEAKDKEETKKTHREGKDSNWQTNEQSKFKDMLAIVERSRDAKKLELLKKFERIIDKKDHFASEYSLFNSIIYSHIYITEQEKKVNRDRDYWSDSHDALQKDKAAFSKKRLELEEREAKIVKIEACHKILNSELADNINLSNLI
ncbi:hypothetical protein UFOVP571_39 [uncultured Caudovirales phage]|uniref:Uncharacterized protein n=1 Tax=uncultured Caudovirales phage TaxID=2100421 RepID=A0A6J5MUQ9_9CAUD|nr:hypothetical protein UFOVP571_39 [uncultured Caudovirales phage]